MSHIESLIADLCPNGVERKKLGEVGTVVRGKRFVKNDMIDSGIPCIHYGEIYTKYGISSSESYSYVSTDRAKTLRFANPGDVIMASAGETIDDIGKSVAWLGTEPVAIHDACYAFSSTLEPKFVSYYFATRMFRDEIRKYISSSKISSISTKSVAAASIPVPPLPVQQEIVRILDMFTHLEAELEAELEARKQQYSYYRQELLRFSNDDRIEWSTLGGVSLRVSSGGTPTKSVLRFYENGHIPWLRTQEVKFSDVWQTNEFITEEAVAETSASWIPENCLIVAISGASAGRSAINKIPLTTNQHCCNIQIDPDVMNYRFAFYWVSSKYEELKSLGRGARSDLNAAIIKSFPIPVPSLKEQNRVVELLDKFDALVNDLSAGLPAEISARRQQYEYYRDKLLTFKEL